MTFTDRKSSMRKKTDRTCDHSVRDSRNTTRLATTITASTRVSYVSMQVSVQMMKKRSLVSPLSLWTRQSFSL